MDADKAALPGVPTEADLARDPADDAWLAGIVLPDSRGELWDVADAWVRRGAAAEAEVARLREALRPFAAVGEENLGHYHASHVADSCPVEVALDHTARAALTIGDFRRAHRVLAGKGA